VKVLFDQNAPRPLARLLLRHFVTRAAELGWEELKNGELIKMAESHGFECMVTSDRNMRHQQNLNDRKLAIVVLPSGQWPKVEPCFAAVVEAVDSAQPGSYIEVPPAIPAPKPATPVP
jgi:predicted nuclease of predicted toxin-antitoxin system